MKGGNDTCRAGAGIRGYKVGYGGLPLAVDSGHDGLMDVSHKLVEMNNHVIFEFKGRSDLHASDIE